MDFICYSAFSNDIAFIFKQYFSRFYNFVTSVYREMVDNLGKLGYIWHKIFYRELRSQYKVSQLDTLSEWFQTFLFHQLGNL